ncbi:hypothetical protein, partial [Burkholderia pseudomallei]|uniref:hypothetical protein n=1 Tax=Burkholderia pseudomallei TaxID=28450 RepID=UPI001F3C262D
MVSHERHQHCGADIEVGHPYERMPERVEDFPVIRYLALVEIVGEPASDVFPVDLPPTNRASRSLVKFVFGEEDEHEEALYGTAN